MNFEQQIPVRRLFPVQVLSSTTKVQKRFETTKEIGDYF
jgi:hypothetical protein